MKKRSKLFKPNFSKKAKYLINKQLLNLNFMFKSLIINVLNDFVCNIFTFVYLNLNSLLKRFGVNKPLILSVFQKYRG